MVVVGAATLFAIERTLADDLVASLDARLSKQGRAVASWLTMSGHLDRLAPRLAAVTGARITIIGADGLDPGRLARAVDGRPADRRRRSRSRRRAAASSARTIRQLREDEPPQYLVAVPGGLQLA